MKKTVLLLAVAILLMCSCEKLSITNYKGVVVEGSTKTPIPDVKVSFTNGSDVYCSTVTNDNGEFDLTVNFTEVTDDYYFLFEGDPDLPVRTLQVRGKGVKTYDYNMVALYTVKSGLFSVSNTKKVRIAMGNLRYQASTNTWRFADYAWDIVGQRNSRIASDYDGWIDLFGWGTSGYDHGANCYQPWSTSRVNSDYMAYGGYNNLSDMTGRADWGYNAISNGGNQENLWRTLSKDEWLYLMNRSISGREFSYNGAYVNGVMGLVLLPDNWETSNYELHPNGANNNDLDDECALNKISADEWNDIFEPAGAVFLPQAGKRIGTEYFPLGNGAGIDSQADINYWSSTASAWDAYILTDRRLNSYNTYGTKGYGLSVRLVQDAN